jgi:hypothetical protein
MKMRRQSALQTLLHNENAKTETSIQILDGKLSHYNAHGHLFNAWSKMTIAQY